MTKSWRGLVLRFHFYAGVLVGPFVLIAALTGVLYAATPQLESWLYADKLTVPASERTVPLSRQVEAAVETQSSATVVAVRPAPESGATTRVLFSSPELGESERLAVFVDPGTGAVVGDLVTYGSSGVLPLRATLDGLHRNLLLGEVGRLYSELAASWLWVVALGGLVLWLSRRRNVTPKPAVRRHAVVGLWVLVGALFLSATGLTWSKYAGENVADLRKTFGWTTPSLKLTGSGDHAGHTSATPTAGTPSEVDSVVATARSAGIDARAVEVTWPSEGGAWKVAEIEREWPTQADSVAVHHGVVVDQVRFADYPLMAKLTRWGIDAHMGVLFGWLNQLLLLALGAGLVGLVVLGYRMWWRRRPTRGFGRPVPRGQWRKAPPAQVVGVLVVAAAVGWFVPLFGLTLLGFLVVDTVLGIAAGRREPEREPVEHAV
ncbi:MULTISPECIES: PepSY-associated TM helix domain-containing protein [unclassified Saccharothrix]|uniref:PepSY-associated TM helix domain-containing protein n=1 Tax=unclassified Saccharothrix TaxID=2593673 RepID=UPI00307DF363